MGWVPGGSINTLAVHAALLPSGRIIYFGGSDYNPDNFRRGFINHTGLYDCATLSITPIESPTTDVFCCGHAMIEGGRLLVAGGTESYAVGIGPGIHHNHWPGINDAWIFEDGSSKWTKVADMHGGRWYPTLVTLADGHVFATSGHPSSADIHRHINNTPEIYEPGNNRWLLRNELGDKGREFTVHDAGFQVQYPRLHVLPNGDLFSVTPLFETEKSSVRYNPTNHQHSYVGGENSHPDFLPAALVDAHNTTSVLLPFLRSQNYRSSVLLCGSNRPLRIDLDDPTPRWRATGVRTLAGSPARYNLNALLLPTGDVFICGGVADRVDKLDSSGVLTPEIYHPETDQWETLEEDEVVRNYHSVALLMPDGRVWTAGSNKDGKPSAGEAAATDTHEPRIRIYEPWYHHRSKPRIAGCASGMAYRLSANDEFAWRISTPDANRIRRVAIIRIGSSTHAFNSDQRYVELEFRRLNAEEIGVSPPNPGGIAPPGDYLLFIIDQENVPSVGSFVWVGDRDPHIGLGPSRVSQPFAIQNQDGRIELFAIGADGAVWHRWQTAPSGPFAEWHSLGGNVSQPFAISNQDGRIELFAIGADNVLRHRWQTAPNRSFAEWHSLGGNVSQAFAIRNQDGRIELFGVRTDRAVWHCWQTAPNGPFAEWHSLGGNVSQPFAIRNQDGRIELFAIGATTDRALWHRWQTVPNGPFAEWHSLGGNVSQPFAIHNQDGRIEVFAIGAEGSVWHRWQTAPNGPFAEWHSLGGNVSQPFAIRNQDGRIELFAIGATTDRALWHRWQTAPSGPFADWHSLGGNVGQPFAIHNQDGRIEVFAIGAEGSVWHRWQIAPNGPFADWDRLD